MKYEKAWADGIEKDFEFFNEAQFEQLNRSFDEILDSPNTKTKRIKGWKYNIRRLRFGTYRLILYICDETMTVYALTFLPRKGCYSKQTKNLILKLVKTIS